MSEPTTQPRLRGPLRLVTAVSTCTLPLLLSCAYAILAFSWRNRLPDEMATHFSGSGAPDDWSSRTSTLWTFTAIVVLLLAVPLALTLAGIARGTAGRLLAAVLSGAAGATGAVSILVLYVQLDGKNPSLGWESMLLVAAAAIVCAAVTVLTFPARATELRAEPALAERGPETPLSAGEKVAFFGSQSGSPWLVTGILLLLVGSAFAASFASIWASVAVLALAVVIFPMTTHLRVRIDSAGITWAFGFGFPRGTIALADITSAESASIHPLEHGGWGHRIRPDGTGIIVRGGPGILLRLRSGRKVAISVSQPDEAVETLRQLLSAGGDGTTTRQ